MKYYSDETKQFYGSEKECMEAERKFLREQEKKQAAEKKKQEERANDAKAVEAARKEMIKAQNKYREAVENFVEKYGSYHYSTKSVGEIPHLFSFFDF